MNANGEIQIRFPDGTRMTLRDDSVSGVKAFHHCKTFRDGVCASDGTLMGLRIDEGIGDEFRASLTCPCGFIIFFLWMPGTDAAMVGKLIVTRHIGFSPSPQKTRLDEKHPASLAPDSVREQIMRSYGV